MRRIAIGALALLSATATSLQAEVPVTLRGSPASMIRQNDIARGHELVFVQAPDELRELEAAGALVRLDGNADYELADFVRYPQARPEMRLFIERLSAQYHRATGEKLVVTSLTRPTSRQPGNSHELSVHPTGIAVDLRVSQKKASREWLESTLLSLEEKGLLDVTRERNPPHYHIALFPEAYIAYVGRMAEGRPLLAAASDAGADEVASALIAPTTPADQPALPFGAVATALGLVLGLGLLLHRRAWVVSSPR